MNEYQRLLEQIRDHLARFNVPRWPERINEWLRGVEMRNGEDRAHLTRTQQSLGGMGSIADIVICPEAGHIIPNDPQAIRAANDTLLRLVGELDAEVTKRLRDVHG